MFVDLGWLLFLVVSILGKAPHKINRNYWVWIRKIHLFLDVILPLGEGVTKVPDMKNGLPLSPRGLIWKFPFILSIFYTFH